MSEMFTKCSRNLKCKFQKIYTMMQNLFLDEIGFITSNVMINYDPILDTTKLVNLADVFFNM